MNKYDDYMNEAFKLLNVGPECGDCKFLIEIKDAYGTGDSPSDYECGEQLNGLFDYKCCHRTEDMKELALDELSCNLTSIAEGNLEWLLEGLKKPEELGYKLLEEL